MGRGDGRSKKGKIFKGSYGKTRKHKVKSLKPVPTKTTTTKKAPATKKGK